MHSANLTTATIKRISGLFIAVLFSAFSYAQENSPYSQYGMGDITPNRNMVSRSMGGIAAGFADFQSINLTNPAAVAMIGSTIFDVGGSVDIRSLKSNISPEKFTSVNTGISYLQLGFPLSSWKAKRSDAVKNSYWGLSFGLKPVTRINYKIETFGREPNIDSLQSIFEGNGGLSQANITTGIKIKKFSLGVSSGYSFGTRDYSRKKILINDTVIYQKSNSEIETRFGGIFLNVGAQYEFLFKNKGMLRVGAYANLQQNLKAKLSDLNQTFNYDGSGGLVNIDTVSKSADVSGTIKYPASYSFGFTYVDSAGHWIIGADIDLADWKSYSNYGQKDPNVQNNYTFRAGVQYFPASAKTLATQYWSFVKYRAGIYYGSDYININKSRPEFGATFGAGFPLTSLRRTSYYDNGFASLNLGVEVGGRGDKKSQSIRENVARFMVGFSMNAGWFQKRRYN